MRALKIIAIGGAAILALLGAAFAYLTTVDFDRYRPLLAEQVKAATGRDFVIGGRLDLKLSLTPTLVVTDLRLANAPGGSRPDMVTIERLEAQIALRPLLSGELLVTRFVLAGTDILLETDGQGHGNWVFDGSGQAAPAVSGDRSLALAVDDVAVSAAHLTYRDGRSGAAQQLALGTVTLRSANGGTALDIAAKGTVDDLPLDLVGQIGTLASLLDGGASPWPVALHGTLDKLSFAATGTIVEPRAAKGIAFDVSLGAERLGDLSRLTGMALPPTGPLKLAFHLGDAPGGFAIDRLEAHLGSSDLKGRATLSPGARPRLAAMLESERLDLADIGATPGPAAPPRRSDRVIPADPLPFAPLKTVDGTVTLHAKEVVAVAATIEDLAIDLALENGLLQARSVTARFRGSPLSATGTVDTRPSMPLVMAAGRLDKFDLGRLLKEMAVSNLLTGALDLTFEGRGSGQSLRQIMAGLDGKLSVTMGKASLATPLFDLIGADLVQSAMPWAAHDPDTRINCAVARFEAKRGIATSEVVLLDTAKVTIGGAGTVDLGTEQLNFLLKPQPKERSLVSLATPIRISGTLASPSVTPDEMALAKGAAGALLGTLINPLGLLVPLVSGGSGDENPCLAALAQAKAPPGAAAKPAPAEGGIGGALRGVGEGLRGLFGK